MNIGEIWGYSALLAQVLLKYCFANGWMQNCVKIKGHDIKKGRNIISIIKTGSY